jgi:hypothetical protein
MSAAATVIGTAVSLGALGYLAATDPKRRRAFRLPPTEGRRAGLAWLVALTPGVVIPSLGGGGGFIVWLGATSVGGWALAAVSPNRVAAIREAVRAAASDLEARFAAPSGRLGQGVRRAWLGVAALRPVPTARRVEALERRVAALEADVAALRRPGRDAEGVVVDLPRPAGRRGMERADAREGLVPSAG